MYKSIKLSKNNQIELPLEFRKILNIHSGDNIELRSVEEGILLTPRKKTTEEDIIGLIKEEIPHTLLKLKKEVQKD